MLARLITLAVQQKIFPSSTSLPHHVAQQADQVLPEIVLVLRKLSTSTRTKPRAGTHAIVKAFPFFYDHSIPLHLPFSITPLLSLSDLYICCTPSLSRYL